MVDGKRYSVYGKTIDEYEVNARALKLGLLAQKLEPEKLTLGQLLDRYIASNQNVLSPSTLRGYNTIRKHRFTDYKDELITGIDWQRMVNEEALLCAPKTVKNAWGLVSASLTAIGEKTPVVHLPKTAKKQLPFLNYSEIQTFLDAFRGKPGELAALLALHSLRESELFALTTADIHDGYIFVSKAMVPDEHNLFVLKQTTKTTLSTRAIPVMIPRLLELLPESGRLVPERPSTVYNRINRVCDSAGLPRVGCHGLRRSFASLCYHLGISERVTMQLGGWSNMQTVHNFYIQLSQLEVNEDIELLKNYYANASNPHES